VQRETETDNKQLIENGWVASARGYASTLHNRATIFVPLTTYHV